MSARRLKGYVVKLPDGTRSEHTREPHSLAHASAHLCDDGAVTPVYAKPKPAPVAPVVAAEGPPPLFVVLHGYKGSFDQLYIDGSVVVTDRRAEAERRAGEWKGAGTAMACQLFAVGAHEAAVEAARREERERISALFATEAERLDIGCEESGVYLRAAEIAKKGQAK